MEARSGPLFCAHPLLNYLDSHFVMPKPPAIFKAAASSSEVFLLQMPESRRLLLDQHISFFKRAMKDALHAMILAVHAEDLPLTGPPQVQC